MICMDIFQLIENSEHLFIDVCARGVMLNKHQILSALWW